MVQSREADGERAGDEVKSYEGIQVGNAAKALKLITMAAMIQVGRAGELEDGSDAYFPEIEIGILVYTILVMAITWFSLRLYLAKVVRSEERDRPAEAAGPSLEKGLDVRDRPAEAAGPSLEKGLDVRDRPAEAVGLSSETRFRLAAGDPVVTDDLFEEEELTRLQAVEVRMSLEEENVSET